jgi:hypothetical protein
MPEGSWTTPAMRPAGVCALTRDSSKTIKKKYWLMRINIARRTFLQIDLRGDRFPWLLFAAESPV